MSYVYMDESGDLSFNNTNGSKFFIITFLISKSERETEIIMKNFYKWTKGKGKSIKGAFFHSTKESTRSIKRILDLSSRRDMNIVSIIINKEKVNSYDKTHTHDLYNKLAGELLNQCEKRGFLNGGKHFFIASRKETSQYLKKEFINYLNKSHTSLLDIEITIDIPQHRKGLEIVDACSYAIFKKLESGDFELYSIIKNKILLEKNFF